MADYEAPIINGQCVPSAIAQQLMVESGAMATRAFLLSDDGLARALLPTQRGGSAAADSGSMVRRSASLSIVAAWPDTPASRLTPYGSRVLVQRGIRVAPDAVEWMTLLTGPLWGASQDRGVAGPGAMKLTIKDEMAMVVREKFDVQTQTDTSERVVDAIARFIREVLPGATIIDLTGSTALCGAMDLQKERGSAIDKLALSIGAECFAGRGWREFVIRPQPTLDDSPRWSISTGDRGTIVTTSRERSADNVYNRVVAIGGSEQSTTAPPWAAAAITDQADPMYYGGPMGKATKTVTRAEWKDVAACTAAANALIERVRGATQTVKFSTLVNPAADPGDVIVSAYAGLSGQLHIIDSIDYPLDTSTAQSVPTRGRDLPADTENAA